MSAAPADVHATPGLRRLPRLRSRSRWSERSPARAGVVARAGAEAFAAGGKRLRPLLVFLAAPPEARAAGHGRGGGRARPPRHARARRLSWTAPSSGAAGQPRGRRSARTWPARPATTCSRAPSPSWPRPATRRRCGILARTSLCLARGEALQRRQRHDPDTSIEAYLDRCTLKTGKLFEAACLLGGRERVARPLRARARRRLPDRRRHPRLRRRHDRDRQGARHGPPRGDAHAAAPARRARGRGRAPGARRRRGGRGAGARRGNRRAPASREVALEYARRARAELDGGPRARGARVARRRRREPPPVSMLRLGRISYVNMAPLFFALDADVEEVAGVPTELNRALLEGHVDVAPVSSIEWARNADRLLLLPRLVRLLRGRGRVDPARLAAAARARALDRGHAGERDLRRARARAAARGGARCLRRRPPTRGC